jgi:DNA modification methylase
METNIIHHKSCLNGLLEVDSESVKLIVTSPPYPTGMREYEEECSAEADKYVEWIKPMFDGAQRVLHPSGSMIIVLMDKIVDGAMHHYIDELKIAARKWGFSIVDTIVWSKSNPLPNVKYERRPIRAYEHCIWLVKNIELYTWRYDDMRKPYSDATIARYGAVGNIETLHKRSGGQAGQTWVDVKPNEKGAACNNIIHGCRFSGRDPGHPAKFPEYLPEWFIKAMTYPGDIVLDPFAGSGTTLIAAKKLDRSYIGYEIGESYIQRANKDLESCFGQIEM